MSALALSLLLHMLVIFRIEGEYTLHKFEFGAQKAQSSMQMSISILAPAEDGKIDQISKSSSTEDAIKAPQNKVKPISVKSTKSARVVIEPIIQVSDSEEKVETLGELTQPAENKTSNEEAQEDGISTEHPLNEEIKAAESSKDGVDNIETVKPEESITEVVKADVGYEVREINMAESLPPESQENSPTVFTNEWDGYIGERFYSAKLTIDAQGNVINLRWRHLPRDLPDQEIMASLAKALWKKKFPATGAEYFVDQAFEL